MVLHCPICQKPMGAIDGELIPNHDPDVLDTHLSYEIHCECLTCPDVFHVTISVATEQAQRRVHGRVNLPNQFAAYNPPKSIVDFQIYLKEIDIKERLSSSPGRD